MSIYSELIGFISEKSKIKKEEIDINTKIYNSGLISSLTVLELMLFIENKYLISIDADALTANNFKNIKAITAFIENELQKSSIHYVN